jgi:hypothetical protein
VTVNPYPDKPLIETENYTLDGCMELDPVVLSVETIQNGVDYQWTRNGTAIAGAGSDSYEGYLDEGDYTVEATSSGCTTESDVLTIRYAEMPEKPSIIAQGPELWYLACSNDSATAYKWYRNDVEITGATDYVYVAGSQLGKYEVAISVNSSCFSISDPIVIPLGTGIEESPFSNLKIYPNPTPGLFTLEMDNPLMGELIIDIFGEIGNRIINIKFTKETSHFETKIDLSSQPSGTYIIQFILDKHKANELLIVE